MKKEKKTVFHKVKPFTKHIMHQLQENGFRYVQVRGYTSDKRLDYMEPQIMVLIPIKELSDNGMGSGIYESLDSPILEIWVANDIGINVFVCCG